MTRGHDMLRARTAPVARNAILASAVALGATTALAAPGAPAMPDRGAPGTAPASPSLAPPSSTAQIEREGPRVPSLARVVALARQNGPAVQMGQATVSTARSGYVGARLAGLGNPYVEVTGERFTSVNSGSLGLNATMWLPLEPFGQRASRIEETDAAVRLTERGLERAQALAVGEAVRAYGEVVVGTMRVRVLNELIEVANVEATSYDARYAAGDATLQDARLARVDLARYSVFVEEARADVTVALSELSRLTGTAFAAPPEGEASPPEVSRPASLDALPALSAPRAEAEYHGRAKERLATEALGPVSVIVSGGRDDVGQPRVGAGLAYAFPVLRRNQGEQARAEAERSRALIELGVTRRVLQSKLAALVAERTQVRRALDVLRHEAEPAAAAAVEAATDMRRSGKGDLLVVLTSRRDLALLRLRGIELLGRDWNIAAQLASITGRLQ
jgi:outer membrane protein, heavy metal efflux system